MSAARRLHRASRARTLHTEGVGTNHGPKAARQRRELGRLTADVRKIIWKTPGRLILWVERDLRQARANGGRYFDYAKLSAPYRGSVLGIGPRAILVLKGSAPPTPDLDTATKQRMLDDAKQMVTRTATEA